MRKKTLEVWVLCEKENIRGEHYVRKKTLEVWALCEKENIRGVGTM